MRNLNVSNFCLFTVGPILFVLLLSFLVGVAFISPYCSLPKHFLDRESVCYNQESEIRDSCIKEPALEMCKTLNLKVIK